MSSGTIKMENDKAASDIQLTLKYVGSSASVETKPAPESLIQETNVDLSTIASSTRHHDYPASELLTHTSDSEVTHSISPKPKLLSTARSMAQLVHRKWKTTVEMGILIGIILIVWVLFSIPTILYSLPPTVKEPETNFSGNVDQLASCDQVVVYEGQACLSELTRWQQCFSPQSDRVYLPSDTNQEEIEAMANFLLLGLPLLSPSPECEAAIRPFLCLYLFGSCDSDSQPHQVTQADCERLRDDVCTQEFILAEGILGEGVLPNCDDLLQQEGKCHESDTSVVLMESDLGSSMTELTQVEAVTDNLSSIVCAEGYYLSSDDSFCRPLCTLWVDPPGVGLDSHNIAVLISVIIALFSSVTAIILALTIQRNTMLTFPTIYLVFFCAMTTIISPLLLIGFTDRKKLFCSSDDLLESFQDETAFCTIIGIINTYGQAQQGFWVAFHALELCWGVIFPYHFQRMKKEKKTKYFHITTILLALLYPTLPALINLHDGYVMADTPTTICFGRSSTVTFFGLILPLSVLIAVATTALIITFWKILKQFVLKSGTQQATSIGKAQAKILFVVCYYVVSGILVLTVYSYYQVAGEASVQAVIRHFSCQSTGTQSGRDCGDVPDVHLEVFDSLLALSLVLIGLLPAVILVFIVKCNCNNRCCVKKNISSTGITLNMQ